MFIFVLFKKIKVIDVQSIVILISLNKPIKQIILFMIY